MKTFADKIAIITGGGGGHRNSRAALDASTGDRIEPSEVDRYVAQPGQACAYMIGQLAILELRERAKSELGERFSLKEFHNVVLDTGTVPLDLLERAVDRYIESPTGSP